MSMMMGPMMGGMMPLMCNNMSSHMQMMMNMTMPMNCSMDEESVSTGSLSEGGGGQDHDDGTLSAANSS
ncbi:hypothetical protein V3C99_010038 [Haemonchus contortus]